MAKKKLRFKVTLIGQEGSAATGLIFPFVNKTMRDRAKCAAGDEVDVAMERDAAERTIDPPSQLKKELAKNKKAQQRWAGLAFTVKKEMANSISGAKQEETKKRRLAKVMQVLKTGAKWTG